MLNYTGTPPLAAMAEIDRPQLIAAELRSLIARIEISMRLIDAAMPVEDIELGHDSVIVGSNEIFVLDDITPRYAPASSALKACRAELHQALQRLSDSGDLA
jgi:hypothetical protein